MPTRCNRGFYCRSYFLLNMFRAPLCPSSGAQKYYTVVAACGISCSHHTRHKTEPVNQHPANRTHNPQLHTRPATWKTTGMYFFISNACNYPSRPHSYNHTLQTGYLTHRPSYTLQTQPPWHSTHLVTNLDNTRHLRLRTQIPQKLTKLLFTFLQHEIPQAATTV